MTNQPLSWPSGNSELANQMRTHDWAATSLGPCNNWSQRLRLMVEQVLASPLIATLVCGPDLLLIYNDAAARLFGDHHPAALGHPLPSVFPAGWETVGPFYERAFAGEVVTIAGQPLDTRGEGAPTEVFDALLMPVRENDGHVAYVHMMGFDIAGRQRDEAALRDSKRRLHLMLDNLTQATWETDAAGVVTTDSPSWRAYTGQSLAQWLGYGWLDAVHVEDRGYAARHWHEAMAAGHDVNAEFRLRSPDGGWRWTNVRAVPLLDDKGLVRKWLGVNIDIDAEKRNAAALHESEERLRQFGEASQNVLWVRDVESLQWQYLSPAFEAVYGMSREAALSGDNYRNWHDLILPEDRAHAVDSIARVARGEQVVFEYRIRRPIDGEIRWLRDTDFPMGGDDGTAPRIGGVGQDITALKATEEALAAAEQRQRLLLEGMPQLVWRAVDDGRWTWASPQWIAHTGLSDAQSQGHGWLNALHPDDREAALAAWAQAPIDGVFQVECRIRDARSGLHHWFQTRGTPIRRADDSVVEWLGTSTDIDEQVRAREYLRQAGEELEQRVAERTAELQQALSDLHQEISEHRQAEERLRQSEKLKAVGQLTGGIAHDFNNMLQGITSALALMRVRLAQGRVDAAQEFIAPAEKAAARAGALTHRLLAFSRQQTLAPKAVTLDQIARDMEDMIRRSVGPSVQVELKLADGHWLVLCDPNQMESALLNLCINARDAMPEGGWLTISTEERVLSEREVMGFEELQPGRYAALAVTDTGTGMTPEVAARVFEPFFTTKPQGQGTGLGMSQIYGFIRQSGGLVQVESALGKGTTVRLCLPFHEMSLQEPQQLINGKTILLVEDEHDLRRMLGAQLHDLGYSVVEAETADVALRVLSTGSRIDLLVTDIGLRGELNGRQLVQAARDKVSNLPVIFITGYAGDNALNGEIVLRKPFKPAVLALLVQEQIG